MPTRAKVCGNYVSSFLAKTESVRLGFDDAVMLDPEGYIAECTGENLFLVQRGRISTPPISGILEGITRDTVITLACDAGIDVVEERLVRDRLYDADEVFLSGTAAEVIGVREVDFRTIASGAIGPITRTLQQAFRQTVRGEHRRSDAWLEPVLPLDDQAEANILRA
jgi:branched-chain amino acid aminotransferase